MKKILIVLSLFLTIYAVHAQTNIKVASETLGFWTLEDDTMLITKNDKVISLSVKVNDDARENTIITGCTFMVDGFRTNGIVLAPGEALNIGNKISFLDSVRIFASSKTTVVMLIKRD